MDWLVNCDRKFLHTVEPNSFQYYNSVRYSSLEGIVVITVELTASPNKEYAPNLGVRAYKLCSDKA